MKSNKLNQKCIDLNFSDVVSILQGRKVLYNQAFGYRDLSNKLLNNTETRFGIASGTKTFTAIGIVKLIEQGFIFLIFLVRL